MEQENSGGRWGSFRLDLSGRTAGGARKAAPPSWPSVSRALHLERHPSGVCFVRLVVPAWLRAAAGRGAEATAPFGSFHARVHDDRRIESSQPCRRAGAARCPQGLATLSVPGSPTGTNPVTPGPARSPNSGHFRGNRATSCAAAWLPVDRPSQPLSAPDICASLSRSRSITNAAGRLRDCRPHLRLISALICRPRTSRKAVGLRRRAESRHGGRSAPFRLPAMVLSWVPSPPGCSRSRH